MSTTRIFQNYLSAVTEIDGQPAVVGDTSVKILHLAMAKWGSDDCLSIAADIEVDGFAPRVGVCLQHVACKSSTAEPSTVHVAVTSTGGLLHGFTLPGAAVHGA